jgi:hypothetical protein
MNQSQYFGFVDPVSVIGSIYQQHQMWTLSARSMTRLNTRSEECR